MKKIKSIIVTVTLLLICALSNAQVKPNVIFSDNMVLQRNVVVPVWGTAKDGETVIVEFAGHKQSSIAKDGKWMVKLNPLKEGGPFSMTIKSSNTITIKNILVGEVWICSGQSNMERQLGPRSGQPLIDNWLIEAADGVNYPNMREFAVAHIPATSPISEVKAKWIVCDSVTVKNFSAVGYFFGRVLYKKLNIPIGLIHTSWGGTAAEKWTSRETLEAYPELKPIVEAYDKALKNYPDTLQKYMANETQLFANWIADTLIAKQNNKPFPRKPSPPINPEKSGDCGGLYNGMIAPLMPYAFKGVIWYQGEANSGRAKQYRTLFPAMITDWRSKWQQGNFPFLFVQLAPQSGNTPDLREAQMMTMQKTPNTAMVVTTDCVDSTFNLHPSQKRPVGERLALAAMALAYGEKIEYSGPIYQSLKIEGNKIILSFTHAGSGLLAKDGELKGFTIAGSNKKLVPAKAEIKGNTIIVFADEVANPVAVRFGFINKAVTNLYNREGLPASPFRTDVE